MQAEVARSRTPKPIGEPGYIVHWDPDRREFKYAMITVVFCGMFLDAFLYLALQHRFPKQRKDLVHEKSAQIAEIGNGPVYSPQREAENAMQLMRDIQDQFAP